MSHRRLEADVTGGQRETVKRPGGLGHEILIGGFGQDDEVTAAEGWPQLHLNGVNMLGNRA